MKWFLVFLSLLLCAVYTVLWLNENYLPPQMRETNKRQMPRVCERRG